MSATVPVVVASASASRSRADSGFGPSLSASRASAGSTTRWPSGDPPDGRGELARRRVLEQEPGRAGLHRAAQIPGPAERGEDHDPTGGQRRAELRRGGQPVQPGHLDVEERDVGPASAAPAARPRRHGRPAATTSRSCSRSRSAASAPRTSAWSSARRTGSSRRPRPEGGTLTRRRNPRSGSGPASTCPPRRGGSLAEAVQPGAPSRARARAGSGRRRRPVVDDLDRTAVAVGDDPDRRPRRVAVAEDVGDPLADGPAEHRVDVAAAVPRARARPRSRSRPPRARSGHRRAPSRATAGDSRSPSRGRRPAPRARRARRRAISAAARAGSSARTRRASSLLSAMSDRLWPSVSCRSRAIRAPLLGDGQLGELGARGVQLTVRPAQRRQGEQREADRADGHAGRDRRPDVAIDPPRSRARPPARRARWPSAPSARSRAAPPYRPRRSRGRSPGRRGRRPGRRPRCRR